MSEIYENPKFSYPLDRYAIIVKKMYHRDLNRARDVWVRGVVNSLLIERGFEDLSDVRVKVAYNNDKATPIISLIPVVGEETESLFRQYHLFFELFKILTAKIESILSLSLQFGSTKNKVFPNYVFIYINLLKITCHLFLYRTPIDDANASPLPHPLFEHYVGLVKKYLHKNELSDELCDVIRESDNGWVVGPHCRETGDFTQERDERFYHSYVRVIKKKFPYLDIKKFFS